MICDLFYMIIWVKIIPQTQGSPNTPLPPTVYQLSGICTPVNFWVRFIAAIAANPKNAFKSIDFIILWLFICKISSTKAQSDNQTIATIPRVFIKITPHINIWCYHSIYVY